MLFRLIKFRIKQNSSQTLPTFSLFKWYSHSSESEQLFLLAFVLAMVWKGLFLFSLGLVLVFLWNPMSLEKQNRKKKKQKNTTIVLANLYCSYKCHAYSTSKRILSARPPTEITVPLSCPGSNWVCRGYEDREVELGCTLKPENNLQT